MSNTRVRAGVVLAVATLTTGCWSDSPTGPKPNTLDLAAIFSQMSIGDPTAIPGAAAAMLLPSPVPAPAIVPSACAYSAPAGAFICPTRNVGGLTFTVFYFLYDAAGHSQSAPDSVTTASVRTVVDAMGTLTGTPGTTATLTSAITDHQDMTLSGLVTSTRTLNGTGTMHVDMTVTGTTTLHTVSDATTTTSNVTFKAPGTSVPNWPTAGTVTTDLTSTSSPTPTNLTSHTVLTFNGSSVVTMVMTLMTPAGHSSVETCMLDLSGATPPSCSF